MVFGGGVKSIFLDFAPPPPKVAKTGLNACQKLAICQFIPTNSTQHNLRVLPREKRQKDAAMTLFASFKSGNGHKFHSPIVVQ
jgi:hypothetical protein